MSHDLMPTPRAARRIFRRMAVALLTTVTAIAGLSLTGAPAGADDLNASNDLFVGSGGERTLTITAGQSVTVRYWIRATTDVGDPSATCNVSGNGNDATVTLSVPSGITASPASFVLGACGTSPASGTAVTFTSSQAQVAPYTVTASIWAGSGPNGGGRCTGTHTQCWNLGQSSFKLQVNPYVPPNSAPTMSGAVDRTVEGNTLGGWTGDLGVTASDAEDGALTPDCGTLPAVFPKGDTAVTCTAVDSGGAGATATFTLTVVDTTPPVLTLPADITTPATGASKATVSFAATATDVVDGDVEATCAPPSGSEFSVGTTTVNCTAADAEGNSSSGSFSVKIVYSFQGFFSPVDNNGVENRVKAGSSVPMKFRLGGDQGLGVLAAGSPVSQNYACTSGTWDTIEQTTTANTGLTYDATADQYNYVWKTASAWKGQCREFRMTLADGSVRTARFRLT